MVINPSGIDMAIIRNNGMDDHEAFPILEGGACSDRFTTFPIDPNRENIAYVLHTDIQCM